MMGVTRGMGKRMDGWLEGILGMMFQEVSGPFFLYPWDYMLVELGLRLEFDFDSRDRGICFAEGDQ